jgi:ABC-type multidrug transport system ATPase subunit
VIGYVPQEATFYDLTVWETLEFYARLRKVAAERIATVLEEVRLTDHEEKAVNTLSGGLKQRLALAVALLSDPPVLVLDEPTANLDVKAQRDFTGMIQALNLAGKTIVFSSHRLDEVVALASRVLVLSEGHLKLECQPVELAAKLGLRQWLLVQVPTDYREDAERLFQDQGYHYVPNGRAVYVRVSDQGKMAPLRALETAQIPVEDFDLVDNDVLPLQDEGQ